MNECKIFDRPRNNPVGSLVSIVVLLLAIAVSGLTGCKNSESIARLTQKDVIGLTEAELRTKYPQVAELDKSFDLLVSKHLHPYHPPKTNKLLRFGRDYLVVELKDGRVIALHTVSG
jgi:hypothetical protein